MNQRGERHGLTKHLRAVAVQAASFAEVFGARDLAHAAGLFHDLGKFHPGFQSYLDWCDEHPGGRRDGGHHKGAGAQLAQRVNPVLPLLIAAHHGGLRWKPGEMKGWFLEHRVASRLADAVRLARAGVPEVDALPAIPMPSQLSRPADWELFWRMVFSCLVDADFLDTEAHFDVEKASTRQTHFDPSPLLTLLHQFRARLQRGRDPRLSALRTEIAETSRNVAYQAPQ